MNATAYGIQYLNHYIPARELPVAELLGQLAPEAIPAPHQDREEYELFVESILNLQSVRVEHELTEAGMLGRVIEEMFATHPVSPADVGVVMHITEAREGPKDNLAQALQYRYGMKNAYTVNVSGNHCANISVALDLAVRMLPAATDRHVLILDVSKTSKCEDRIVGSYGILGDAAGLMLVGAGNSRLKLLDTVISSNGALHAVDLSRDHSLLHAKYILKGITGLLARNGVPPGQVDHIVLQNANPMLYLHAIVEAGLDTNRIFTGNLGRYGHLNSLDVLVNLRQLLAEAGNAGRGSRVLVLGMGWAGTYTSSLLEVA